ncbi:hypothetical protein ACQEV4_02065 [Streptomyces shenzhenensis]|uniref:hypothetical protein n=1 Tax=Streptomyces shenzhenensis TaxID=943815 RepID=UPI003D8BC298
MARSANTRSPSRSGPVPDNPDADGVEAVVQFAAALKAEGVTVVEVDCWRTRPGTTRRPRRATPRTRPKCSPWKKR